MKTWISLCLLLVSTWTSSRFFQLQKRFQENLPYLQNMTLPPTSGQMILQQQLREYGEMHQSTQFNSFVADPELSAQFLLKKDNGWSQSLYFMGKQVSNLLLQVAITHQPEVHTFDNQSIELYIINCQTREVILQQRVKHVRLFMSQVVSELYQIRVGFRWQGQPPEEQEPSKHVRLNLEVTPILSNKNNHSDEQDGKKTNEKIQIIRNQTDRIFLDSLQIWDQIQSHHRQHSSNQQFVYLNSYGQLILVLMLNIVQLVLLRRTLKSPRLI